MIEIREYIAENGKSPFATWFNALEAQAAAKVATYLTRIENGNTSNVKSVGRGVSECKIDFGPGFRVYFGREGNLLVILIGGGTKKHQQRDIEKAQAVWQAYKERKKGV